MKLFIKRSKAAVAALGGAAVAVLAVPAHAAVDVSGVVDEISSLTGASGPIATIGAAVLLVVVGVAAFKWVRRAIS